MPDAAQDQVKDLTVNAVARLREAILSGTLAQGERLSEPKLAAQLQLSRAPLREALRTLKAQGLIQTSPQRGTFVTRANPELCAEAYALRHSLEAGAVLRRLRRPELFRFALDRALDAMSDAAMRGDHVALLKAHGEFHGCAYITPGARMLPDIWSRIDDITRLYFQAFTFTADEARAFVDRHVALADAFFASNAESVNEAVRLHLINSEALLPFPFGSPPADSRAPVDLRLEHMLRQAKPPPGRLRRKLMSS